MLSLFDLQVTKYVEREILNHRVLMHPHIVQFKEVKAHIFRMILAQNKFWQVLALWAGILSSSGLTRWLIGYWTQVFLTPHYLAIAMEFVAGGDMFEYVVRKGGLKESEARWFFQQLIVGVDYLHRMVWFVFL